MNTQLENRGLAGMTAPLRALLATAVVSGAAMALSGTSQPLVEPGLDSDTQPLLGFAQPDLDRWMQENAVLVTGLQTDGVAPFAGDGMVRLAKAGLTNTEVRQRVDVSSQATSIDAGLVTMEVRGMVNPTVAGVSGGVLAFAFDAGQAQVGFIAGALPLDADVGTWETAATSLPLPVGTRYVEMRFYANNASLPVGEHLYGDEAVLCLLTAEYHHGLPHISLGQAQMTGQPDGSLLVANIGSSGLDGVRVELGSGVMGLGLDLDGLQFDFGGDPDAIRAVMMATVGGTSIPAAELRIESLPAGVEISADFDALGVSSTTVRFYQDDVLVEEQIYPESADGPPGFFICPNGQPAQWTCVDKVVWTCDDGVTDKMIVETCGYECFATPTVDVAANKVEWSRNTGAMIESIDSVELYGTTIGSFTVTDEAVQFGDAMVSVQGDGLLDIGTTALSIPNLGSSGMDGFTLSVGPAERLDFAITGLLDQEAEGASITSEILGTVSGVAEEVIAVTSTTIASGLEEWAFDFPTLGSTTFTLDVYNAGVLVGSLPAQPNGSGFTSQTAAGDTKYKILKGGGILVCLPEVIIVGAWAGDEVGVTPNAPTELPSSLAEVRVITVDVGDITLASTASTDVSWTNLGGALGGALGDPSLIGSGPLTGGSDNALLVTDAAPASPLTLVVGFSNIAAPFKGGTLFPNPDMLVNLLTDAAGGFMLPFTWPAGIPAGFSLYFQAWIIDPTGPQGFTATNGRQGTTP